MSGLNTNDTAVLRPDYRRGGIASTLAGLVWEPSTTAMKLLGADTPPYALALFSVLAIALFGPMAYVHTSGVTTPNMAEGTLALVLVFAFAVPCFVVLETAALRVFGVRARPSQVAAAVAYSSGPLTVVLVLFYLFSYIGTGRVSFVYFVSGGASDPADPFLRLVPVVGSVALMVTAIVYFYCLRVIGSLGGFSALVALALSAGPAWGAVVLAGGIADTARPGTAELLARVLAAPSPVRYLFP